MIKYFTLAFTLLSQFALFAQQSGSLEISEMKWGADFNIHIKFSNDSSSIYDVKALYHSSSENAFSSDQATYYPVNLDKEFIDALKNRSIESFVEDSLTKSTSKKTEKSQTLWSAIHYEIGGGWIHFINCLIYSFESGNLSLTAPLMKRPESDWKPKPMTESYKRTKNWKYYAPVDQKLAIKEYKLKEKNGELGDIPLLPDSFSQLFLNTTSEEYKQMSQPNQFHNKAIIDMVKLLIGSNYLGREQIDYISNAVLSSVLKYNINNLPSVIIFDDFQAAVAMTLDNDGYQIEKVVFNNESNLSQEEIDQRIERMEGIIAKINEVNKKVFENKLKSYYK